MKHTIFVAVLVVVLPNVIFAGIESNVYDFCSGLQTPQDIALEYLKEEYCSLGMKSRKIPDSAISVSSEWTHDFRGKFGRLDEQATFSHKFTVGDSYGCWHAQPSRVGEWIQVDLGTPKSIAGIITQGRSQTYVSQWVASFKVKCSNTNSAGSFTTIMENGIEKVFPGNSDRDTKVVNMFPSPVTCRYVRVYPQTWHEAMVMRIELIRAECFGLF